MENILKRLAREITHSEVEIAKKVVEEIGENKEMLVNVGEITQKLNVTRSTAVNLFRLLAVAGIIEKHSRGMKGTHIKVLNTGMFKKIAEM